MYCRRCRRESVFRRLNRQGWLQRVVLSRWFGLYPWECVQCRVSRFLRNEGKRSDQPVDARGFVEP